MFRIPLDRLKVLGRSQHNDNSAIVAQLLNYGFAMPFGVSGAVLACTVRATPDADQSFELVDGRRLVAALRRMGWHSVPAHFVGVVPSWAQPITPYAVPLRSLVTDHGYLYHANVPITDYRHGIVEPLSVHLSAAGELSLDGYDPRTDLARAAGYDYVPGWLV